MSDLETGTCHGTLTFVALATGDQECFCWLTDADTYRALRFPPQLAQEDEQPSEPGVTEPRWLYPGTDIGRVPSVPLKWTMTWEPVPGWEVERCGGCGEGLALVREGAEKRDGLRCGACVRCGDVERHAARCGRGREGPQKPPQDASGAGAGERSGP